jgi:hypothetical protein
MIAAEGAAGSHDCCAFSKKARRLKTPVNGSILAKRISSLCRRCRRSAERNRAYNSSPTGGFLMNSSAPLSSALIRCCSSELEDIRMMWIARSWPDNNRVSQHSSIPDIGVSSTLVINTLTSPSDLMKSSASLASTNVATVWRSFSRSFDTAFKTVRLGSTTTIRMSALTTEKRNPSLAAEPVINYYVCTARYSRYFYANWFVRIAVARPHRSTASRHIV